MSIIKIENEDVSLLEKFCGFVYKIKYNFLLFIYD